MPITIVTTSDTFDQWREKDNAMIEKVNSLGSAGDIVSTANPVPGDILLFDGTTFRNVTLSGDILVNSNGVVSVTGGSTGGMTKGRLRFAGSISGLY